MEEDSSLAFYTRVCISLLILESNPKHNLGYQEIFVTGFYLLFHLGIYLQIEWLCRWGLKFPYKYCDLKIKFYLEINLSKWLRQPIHCV